MGVLARSHQNQRRDAPLIHQMLEPMRGLLVKALNPGLDMSVIAIALSAAAQNQSLNEGLGRPFLEFAGMVDRQVQEGVRNLRDLAKVHFKETPSRLVGEHHSVAFVFVQSVCEWKHPWLAPSSLDSSVCNVNHRQIDMQLVGIEMIIG